MADLRSDFVGIKSPNPFWLASAPPTDKEYNVRRAFEAGWGGVVWKTLGDDPPIVNVNGPRYGAIWGADRRLLGLNNIELITDRPLEVNLREIKPVKRDWPDRALVVSLMVPCDEEPGDVILTQVEDTGADGVELNFGCPHGMSERGMGSAVGQVPEYIEMVARWCKDAHAHAGDRQADAQHHRHPLPGARGQAGRRRRGVADQHDQLDHLGQPRQLSPEPIDRRQGQPRRLLRPGGEADRAQHGGRDRPRSGDRAGLPISGIGGITTWRDAAEFMALGAGNVQVCTAAMTYGFKIVQEMISGLVALDGREGPRPISTSSPAAPCPTSPTGSISTSTTSPRRGSTRTSASSAAAATSPARTPRTRRSRMQARPRLRGDGRRMRRLQSLRQRLPGRGLHHDGALEPGQLDQRTGKVVESAYANWTTHPNNPVAQAAE